MVQPGKAMDFIELVSTLIERYPSVHTVNVHARTYDVMPRELHHDIESLSLSLFLSLFNSIQYALLA